MNKSLIVILVILLLGALVSVGVAFSVGKIRDYIYREISYQFITDQVIGDEKDKEKIALLLFDYVYTNLNDPNNIAGSKVIDQTSWNDLVRGIGACDQQSWALATLLSKARIPARFVMLKDKDGISPHTVTEVFLKGKWRVFDPLNGLVFHKPDDGSLATLEDISNDPSIISQHPRVKLLQEEARKNFLDRYARIFPIPNAPRRWGSLLDKKNRGLPRKAINRVIELTAGILGKPFVNRYQDVYLLAKAKSFKDPAEGLYYRARNYHLYQRTNLAQKTYQQIIQDYPRDKRAEDGLYYLGVLLFEIGQPKASIQKNNDLFISFPNTKWKKQANYFLGRAYEDLKDFQNARVNYNYASFDLDTDAAWRLSKLP